MNEWIEGYKKFHSELSVNDTHISDLISDTKSEKVLQYTGDIIKESFSIVDLLGFLKNCRINPIIINVITPMVLVIIGLVINCAETRLTIIVIIKDITIIV